MDGLRRTRLTSPPQAFAFPEPQGSFSIEHSSVSWFLRQQKKESGTWFTTFVFLRKEPIYLATRKHDSVVQCTLQTL
jgi:hypothetical protein